MDTMLHILQPTVKSAVASAANDAAPTPCDTSRMAQLSKIHRSKTPVRIHFIAEWADHRGLIQADISSALDVDKSTVSRWFAGQVPTDKYIVALAELLQLEHPSSLFRHPDDDWLSRFFRERNDQDRTRAIEILKAAFPSAQKLR